MQFSKKALVAIFALTPITILSVQAQGEIDQETIQEQLKKSKARAVLPFDIPENQAEKMREAMQGRGDYALPQGSIDESTMPEQERRNMEDILERMNLEKEKMEAQGLLDGFDSSAQRKVSERYRDAAKVVADQSQSGLEMALQKHAQVSNSDASAFVGKGDPTVERDERKGGVIFVSFSMEDDALRNVFIRAKQQNAEVFLKGMHPKNTAINETSAMIKRIGHGIENPPMTRFNPKAFEKYGVTQVPTILYRDKDSHATASGILNIGWVKEKAEATSENLDLGNFGPTSPVIEKSILEVFKERIAGIDWDSKKTQAKEQFWRKKDFHLLPKATEDKIFFIDPTVSARSDIKTPHGDLLARKGDVVNPLKNQSLGVTMLVFDAQDNDQVEWVDKQLASNKLTGHVMIMTTRLSRENGWEHLQSLHDHFKRRIFMLPKELISKFKLTGVPAVVSTELEKELMKIEQFKI